MSYPPCYHHAENAAVAAIKPNIKLDQTMSYSDRNTGKAWTPKDNNQLKNLATQNTPTRVIGFKMGRTESAVYSQASSQGVSLSPTNQRPYNRRRS